MWQISWFLLNLIFVNYVPSYLEREHFLLDKQNPRFGTFDSLQLIPQALINPAKTAVTHQQHMATLTTGLGFNLLNNRF